VNPADQTRAFRSEAALEDAMASRHGRDAVLPVLDALRVRGLVVRLRSPAGEPGWELVHDSLVPRVLAWLDRRDLARRGAIELLRHHLRRSRPGQPNLLVPDELREVGSHPGIIDELDAELSRRGGSAMTARQLVSRSRRSRRVRWTAVISTIAILLTASAVLSYQWLQQKLRADGNIGRFRLELSAYDWDSRRHAPIPVPLDDLPGLDWELYEPSEHDDLELGVHALSATRTLEVSSGMTRVWLVEAPGGRTQLRIRGRGRGASRCDASVVPLRRLPGFASRDTPRLQVRIPTCQTSSVDMIAIPVGPFISGGRGDPPISLTENLREQDISPEQIVDEPAFSIDRTEVSNAAFLMFTSAASSTTMEMPVYPDIPAMRHAGEDSYPVGSVAWKEARAFCRFMGKELPTDHQWQKSMRGGVMLGPVPNPRPRRNLPWGDPVEPAPANLNDTGTNGPAPVGSSPGDVSPYGVLDLAGNVQEWTLLTMEGFVFTRGCNWEMCSSSYIVPYMAIPNARIAQYRNFELGFRCVTGTSATAMQATPGP
jgi:hypothetical protein